MYQFAQTHNQRVHIGSGFKGCQRTSSQVATQEKEQRNQQLKPTIHHINQGGQSKHSILERGASGTILGVSIITISLQCT